MKSEIIINPRYQETDQMGIIHHSVYAIWYEMGRVQFCEDIGLPFEVIEKKGLRLAMIEMKSNYKKSVQFGQLIKQQTYLTYFSKIRMIFKYELFDENNDCVHIGETTLVWLDLNHKPINITKSFQDVYQLFIEQIEPTRL